MRNIQQIGRSEPDPATVVQVRRSRSYLQPNDISKRGLDGWSVVRVTGHREEEGEVRIFFEPHAGDWKSAVQRPISNWEQLLSALSATTFKELHDNLVWVKLCIHLGKTDIAEIAPYTAEVDRHVNGQ